MFGLSLCYADTYTIALPDNLPPTFRGRTLKFSYELVIGTCRAGTGGSGATSANSISRVMKVPIRIYNNVVGKSLALFIYVQMLSISFCISWQGPTALRPPMASLRAKIAPARLPGQGRGRDREDGKAARQAARDSQS